MAEGIVHDERGRRHGGVSDGVDATRIPSYR